MNLLDNSILIEELPIGLCHPGIHSIHTGLIKLFKNQKKNKRPL